MDERRRHKRYPIAYPVERERQGYGSIIALVDVSKGGVAFTSKEALHADDHLDLKIFLKRRMFSLKAIIVHATKLRDNLYNIGAKFLETPAEFNDLLDKEIQEITQIHREANLYRRKNVSFLRASEEYLEK